MSQALTEEDVKKDGGEGGRGVTQESECGQPEQLMWAKGSFCFFSNSCGSIDTNYSHPQNSEISPCSFSLLNNRSERGS